MRKVSWANVMHHSANQVVVQALGFATGVLVVRALAKTEYAQYSLAIATVAALTQLTDSGISAVLLSRGAEALHDRERLATLFRGAMRYRFLYGSICIVVGCGWLYWLLIANEASPADGALYVAIVALGLFPVMSMGIYLVLFRLLVDLHVIRRVGMTIAIVRFLCVGGGYLLAIDAPAPYLAITSVCSMAYAFSLAVRARPVLPKIKRADVSPDFGRAVRGTLPSVLLLIAGEQLLLLMLSVRGTPEVVAEINAMSRFGVAFALVNAVLNDIAVPSLARAVSKKRVVLRQSAKLMGAYAAACATLVVLTWVVAPLLIFLLGPGYVGLEVELVGVAIAFALNNLAVMLGLVNNSRGWIKHSWTYAPFIVIWFVAILVFADFRDVSSIVLVLIAQSLPAIAMQLIRFFGGIKRLAQEA